MSEESSPLDRLKAVVAEYQEKLYVQHWQIHVLLVPTRADRIADIEMHPYDRMATLRYNDDEPEEEWPWTVCHELLHIVVKPMADCQEHLVKRVHAGEKDALEPLNKRAEEEVIHHLVPILVGKPVPFHKNMRLTWKLVE